MGNSTTYLNRLQGERSLSVGSIVSICKDLLPSSYRFRPWTHPELNNGLSLLCTEEGMNAYIASYGEMHYAKCRAAFQNFPFEELTGAIEIVDWGCGQGIGSLCAIEMLDQHDFYPYLRKVTLIEPSSHTLERAKANVSSMTRGSITIEAINRFLPGRNSSPSIEGLSYTCTNVIHIFSNILDITSINLSEVARMATVSGHQHYFLCMGPVNNYSFRIDQFCGIFGDQYFFSDIKDPQYGRTSDTFHSFTCRTKCFHYDGSPLKYSDSEKYVPSSFVANSPVLNDYDPQLSVENGLISEKMSTLYRIFNRILSENDIILLAPDIKGDKPHAVIVRPNMGILIIDLFDEDLKDYHFPVIREAVPEENIEAEYDYKNLENKSKGIICSPLDTIDTYQKNLAKEHLKGLFEDIFSDKRNWSVIRKMVVFTKNTTKDAQEFFLNHWDYTKIIGCDFLEDKTMQDSLLGEMQFDRPNSLFNEKVFKRFMHIISPKWHSFREGKVVNATTPQRNLSKSHSGSKQKISGVAGSGKTYVLASRAVNAQVRTGRDILVLTFNIALAGYMRKRIGEIRADFSWDKIHINYYHQFFRSNARRCGYHVSFGSYMDVRFFDGKEGDLPKYAAILVDEVQDYQTEWLQILQKYFLAEDGEFVVFGDPKQNIYHRPVDTNGDVKLGVINGTWNHDLKDGKRFSVPQFARLAMDFQKTFFTNMPTDRFQNAELVQGSLLTSLKYAKVDESKRKDMKKMAQWCLDIFSKFGIQKEETVVLAQTGDILRDIDFNYRALTHEKTTTTIVSKEEHEKLHSRIKEAKRRGRVVNGWFKIDNDDMEHYRKATFTMDDDNLKISTIQSFKGWEAESVILFLQAETTGKEEYCLRQGEDNKELIYAAITRAKSSLFILNLGNEKYDQFFRQFK